MLQLFQLLLEGVKTLGKWLISKLARVISFFTDILGWFKGKDLNPQKDTPFIVKADAEMKKMLGQAPTKNVGVFNGIYDKTDDTIEYKAIDSDKGIDRKTEETLGGEKLVILS